MLAQHRYRLQTQAEASESGGARDVDIDHVAILEDRGDLVARRNAFDLDRGVVAVRAQCHRRVRSGAARGRAGARRHGGVGGRRRRHRVGSALLVPLLRTALRPRVPARGRQPHVRHARPGPRRAQHGAVPVGAAARGRVLPRARPLAGRLPHLAPGRGSRGLPVERRAGRRADQPQHLPGRAVAGRRDRDRLRRDAEPRGAGWPGARRLVRADGGRPLARPPPWRAHRAGRALQRDRPARPGLHGAPFPLVAPRPVRAADRLHHASPQPRAGQPRLRGQRAQRRAGHRPGHRRPRRRMGQPGAAGERRLHGHHRRVPGARRLRDPRPRGRPSLAHAPALPGPLGQRQRRCSGAVSSIGASSWTPTRP